MSHAIFIAGTNGGTLATLSASNRKTGLVIQCYHVSPALWAWLGRPAGRRLGDVVRKDEPCPAECPRSLAAGAAWGACYARKSPLTQGLVSAFKGWRNHGRRVGTWCDVVTLAGESGAPVRFGAYGDPAMVDPSGVAAACRLLKEFDLPYMGYTHAWSRPEVLGTLRGLLMASTENDGGSAAARAAGWMPAQVSANSFNRPDYAAATAKRIGKSVACPAQARDITCSACRLCEGDKVGVVFHEH